ncbi:MAG: uracil-DNA glycosylase family 4 [Paracoccaceae bacterium]|jgi:uracil-DNA glycosylase family 4
MTGQDPYADPAAGWTHDALRAALAWQIEAGVDETIAETPCDRFAESARADAARSARAAPAPKAPPARFAQAVEPEPAPAVARDLAAAAPDLAALHAAVQGFDRCALRGGAKSTVFCDGRPGARVMIVGEAPGRDEDREGKPFVGKSGALLDRMLATIGLSRGAEAIADAVYITNLSPWRPLENRQPSTDEAAMLLPFLERHIELAAPQVLLLMGNAPWKALMNTEVGITRARGVWTDWRGVAVLPTFHPAYLLRTPARKREAWRDLMALRDALARPL